MKAGILVAAVCGGLAIQLIPVDRENPPVETEVRAPMEVRQVLRGSCYDCHSHQTRWPWYGYVAPISWLMAYDVTEAREHLNFSAWNRYDARERRKKRDEVGEEVDEGEMPLWYYLPLDPEARLSEEDKRKLRAWAGGGEEDEE